MGRAARHVEGRVIMYADRITESMKRALSEVKRRRKYQLNYNKKHNITPTSIEKPIREKLVDRVELLEIPAMIVDADSLTPMEKKKLIKNLQTEMRLAAQDLNFELAGKIRDRIKYTSEVY